MHSTAPSIEIIRKVPADSRILHAVLDFDGTVSLIREGWQGIMVPYFTEVLATTPLGRHEKEEDLRDLTRELVFLHTGKQTIYQCIALAEEVEKRAGQAKDPQDYKDEYHRRLLLHIDGRLSSLRESRADPEGMTVPGSREMLTMLQNHGVTLYLASGTDEHYVREEVALLGLNGFFEGRIYGAKRDYKTFSKKRVIDGILRDNALTGASLLGLGDGYVEIENIRAAGGIAVGVASNESERAGLDEWKRARLLCAGADAIVPDYRNLADIERYLFG